MNGRTIVSIIFMSFSLFLIACGGNSGGDNVSGRASLNNTSRVQQFAVGNEHACAVLKTGKLMCWGRGNYGQLNDGTTIDRYRPVRVSFN